MARLAAAGAEQMLCEAWKWQAGRGLAPVRRTRGVGCVWVGDAAECLSLQLVSSKLLLTLDTRLSHAVSLQIQEDFTQFSFPSLSRDPRKGTGSSLCGWISYLESGGLTV